MAIARVSGQTPQAAGASPVTSIAVTLPQNVVAGNAIMAVGKHRNSTPTFSDNLGNSYAVDAALPVFSADNGVRIGSAKNLASGGACTLTFGSVTSGRLGVSAMEYSGFTGGAAFDQTAQANGTSTTPSSGATPTTTAADELLIGGGSDGSGQASYTWGSSFGLVAENSQGRHSMGDRVVAATGTYSATATFGTSTPWGMIIATYKEVGGGGAAKSKKLITKLQATNRAQL